MRKILKGEVSTFTKEIDGRLDCLWSMFDINSFLQEVSLQKSATKRLISWMVKLGVVKADPDAYSISLLKKYLEYTKMAENVLGDNLNTPTKLLPVRSSDVLNLDIKRMVYSVHVYMKELMLDPQVAEDALQTSFRVLSLLELVEPKLPYTQGFDRYFFIFYILGRQCTAECNLPMELAEALAYFMMRPMLQLSNFLDIINQKDRIQSWFDILDEKTSVLPNIHQALEQAHINGTTITMRWFLLLFANEHPIQDTLLIWDQVLARKDPQPYVGQLYLAHLQQIPNCGPRDIAFRIAGFRDWDVIELIHTSNTYNDVFRPDHTPMATNFFLLLSVLIIISTFLSMFVDY